MAPLNARKTLSIQSVILRIKIEAADPVGAARLMPVLRQNTFEPALKDRKLSV